MRVVSSVTIRSALMSKVKFAVKVAPSAMTPPAQFVARLQLPAAFTFQVLVAAWASGEEPSVASRAVMLVLRMVRRWLRVFFINGEWL